MYRGCCIEWDCLMMHRIKSVAFSWAPFSLIHSSSSLLSFTHTHTLWLLSSFLPSLSPLFPSNPHPPPPSYTPASLFFPLMPAVLDCWPHVALFCCLTPSITVNGESVRVCVYVCVCVCVWGKERSEIKKSKNKIWLEEMREMKTDIVEGWF